MDTEGKEEDTDSLAVGENLEAQSPKIESVSKSALDLLTKIHTPSIGATRSLDISGDFSHAETDYKALYEAKVKELNDFSEFLFVEQVTKLQDSLEQLKAENEKAQIELRDRSSEVDTLRERVKEKDKELINAERSMKNMESLLSGTEMQFEQYKRKQERREQDLLDRLADNGADLIEDLKKSIASLDEQNKKLEISLDEQKQAREEEMKNNEKIINLLKEENCHNEKIKHDIELALLEKTRELEQRNKYVEKASELESELSSLRETILTLQNTISTLETEKQELSVRISETPSIAGDPDVTLMDETLMSGNNLSLMEMDETLVCELIGKNLPDAFQPQIKTLASTVETLRVEKKNLIDENEKLSAQIYENVQETDDLKIRYECLLAEENSKIMGLRETLRQMKNDYHALQEQLKDTEASVKVLQSDKDKLVDDFNSKKEEWNLLKIELERKVEFHAEKATRCEEKIMEFNSTISSLVNKNESLEKQLEIAQSQANNSIDLNTDFKNLVEKHSALLKENAQNKSRLSELEGRDEKNKMDKEAMMNELESQREKMSSDYFIMQEKDIQIHEQSKLIANLEERWQNAKPEMDKELLAGLEKSHKQQLMKLEEEKKAHETEIETLKKAIDCILRESREKQQTFNRKAEEWKETFQNNCAKLNELIEDNGKLKVILSQSRENVKMVWELRQQISEYTAKCNALNIERGHLKHRLDVAERLCEQLKKDKESLFAELDGARRDVDSVFSAKLDERDDEIVTLREELEERNSELKSVKTCVLQLQLEEADTMKAIEEMRDQHIHDVHELKEKISYEEEQKRQLQTERDQLTSANKDLTKVITELRSLLEGLHVQVAQKDDKIYSAEKSQEHLEKELDTIREKHRQELENMRTDSTQIDRLKSIITAKTQAFDQLSFTHKNLQRKYDELQNQHETMLTELESLREKVSDSCANQDVINKELMHLHAQLEGKTAENNKLTENMRDFSGLKEELQKLRIQNHTLKTELNSAMTVSGERQDEIINLTSQIQEQNEKIDNLQRNLASVSEAEKKSVSDDTIKSLDKENQELIRQLKSMKSEYDKKLKSFRDANSILVQERDHLKKKLNVIDEKNSEIELLKDRVRKKDKNIDKLNALIKEKMVEIHELKGKKNDPRMGRDSSPTTVQKERRRSDRQSIHDINRSIYFELEHEVGTMTDPTSDLCQCADLEKKISSLQTELTLLKCQLSTAKRDLEENPLKNDVIMLQLEVKNKDVRINNAEKETARLREELYQIELKSASSGTGSVHPSSNHASSQTEELRPVKMYGDDAMNQKENEAQNGNIDYKREYEQILSKYNNLKRAYFKVRAKYDAN